MDFSIRRLEISSFLRRLFADFKLVFVVFMLVLAVSLAIFIGVSVHSWLSNYLAASGNTPWGVVTSLFVHDGIEHLVSNMIGLFVFTVLFALCNSYLADREKKKRVMFLVVTSFLTAVFTNLLWILLIPQIRTAGASGLVFAFEGVASAFALTNGLNLLDWGKFKARDKSSKRLIFINLAIFSLLFVQIFLFPQVFLNVEAGVNVFVHASAFLISFFSTIVWTGVRKKVLC